MKKVLIGLLAVSLTLVFAASAMAADFAWSGDASFGIAGNSNGVTGNFFGGGNLYLTATATSGAWEVGVELGEEGTAPADYLDPYISYTAEAFTLTLEDSIDNAVFGTVTGVLEGKLGNIPADPGIKMEISTGGFAPYVIVNNCVKQESSTTPVHVLNPETGATKATFPLVDTDEMLYSFAGGADFTAGGVDLGVIVNFNGVNDTTSYGATATYSMDALSLAGKYGGSEALIGYYGEIGYSLAGGGSFTLSYGATDADWSEIYGEFVYPVAEAVDFTVDATSTDDGGVTTTEYEAKVGFSF